MDDLWQQFHRLPKAIRDAVSRPEALAAVDSLEQRYPSLDLASFVMRVVVKEFPIGDMAHRLQDDFKLPASNAETVADELTSTIFNGLKDYLGIVPKAAPAPIPPPRISTPAQTRPPVNLPTPRPAAEAPRPTVVSPATATTPPPTTRPVSSTPSAQNSTHGLSAPTGPIAPTQAYSDDDAAEIAQQTRRLQDLAAPTTASLDDIAQQIIDQHHLAFHDELLAKRALAILKARLKDIRGKDETVMMLVRGPKVGGLGLDQDLAKGVVDSLEQHVTLVKERGMVHPPEHMAPPPPPARPPLQAQQPSPRPPLFRDAAAAIVRPSMPLPSFSDLSTSPPPKPAPAIHRPADIPAAPAMPPTTTPTGAPPVVVRAPSIVRRERTIERPAVADITRPAKMLGPAEEMRSMTLTEFRRLGQGANESANRLLEKFQLLQKESFTLWSEALNGWRLSEVHQLYLAMGRQSMEQAMGITEVIKQRAAANELYLSEHEFIALADLNRQLQS